ncbi:MAG TPA: NUDIX domain-containing protein [Dehalococcoidia bacterium]|nr:NUDIX domain-containing protein [Dehalococcoidia bacterium]
MAQEIPIRCYGVSAFLLKKENDGYRVLLLKRKKAVQGIWAGVSGKIESGEKAWQAVLREIKEETGLTPEKLYSADTCEQFYEVDKDSIWIAPVFVAYVSDNAAVTINEEHSESRWFTFEEALLKVPFTGQRRILRHIQEEFIQHQPVDWLLIDID